MAGVNIQRSASGVGGSTRVTMRGNKSISGDNNVLYVVDGVPMVIKLTELATEQDSEAAELQVKVSPISIRMILKVCQY